MNKVLALLHEESSDKKQNKQKKITRAQYVPLTLELGGDRMIFLELVHQPSKPITELQFYIRKSVLKYMAVTEGHSNTNL